MVVDIDRHYDDYASHVGDEAYEQQVVDRDDRIWHNGNYPTNAVYAVVTSADKLERVDYYVCYGRLNEWSEYYCDSPDTIFLQILSEHFSKYDIDEVIAYNYYNWLFNHSPFSKCFITKDAGKALKDKVVVLTAHIDSSLLIGACSAVRLPWESYYREYNLPSIIRLWHGLVMNGVKPTVALAMANNFNVKGDKVNLRSDTAGHQFLKANEPNTILNFISSIHYATNDFSESRELDEDYGVTGIWRKDHPKAHKIGDVKEFFRSRILGVSGKKVNPFGTGSASTEYKLPDVIEGLTIAAKDIEALCTGS